MSSQARTATSAPVRLIVSRGQRVSWALGSRVFRALICAALVVGAAAAGWVFRAELVDAYQRTIAGWSPQPQTPDVSGITDPALNPANDPELAEARSALTALVGEADGVVAAKRAAGVAESHFPPVVDITATARAYLDGGIIFPQVLTGTGAQLRTAIDTLQQAQPPAPEVVTPPSGTGGGSSGGGGSNSGGGSGGGASTRTVTVSASITCTAPGNITANASGGGTVTVTISGPASGQGSGSGSAVARASGPAGAYTATATGTGSASITSLVCR